MSKQTRKKSSTAAAGKSAGAAPAKTAKTAPSKPAAGKLLKSDGKPAKASHKPQTKTLKPAAVKTPVKPAAAGLAEGAKAPAFTLQRDGGKTVKLAEFAGKKLVIFFYPRADTPGCTTEAIAFTRLESDFAAAKTSVIGVSADPLKKQEAFRDKHRLGVPLMSDEAHQMIEAYGAWGEKSMYGRSFEGILRTTVLIGADGKVARVWRNVKVDGHADEVLAAARALS